MPAGVGQTTASIKVRKGLEALARDRGEWRDFNVTYDDLNPFSGGVRLTIFGTGEVSATWPTRALRTPQTRNVPLSDLKELVNLLLEQKAWEQHEIPEMPFTTDQTSIRLTIGYGNDSTMIWEGSDYIGEFMKKTALIH
jgi:hypothetical protein